MLDPTCDTPRAVTEAITKHGGTNPYGRPMWRVVLAQNHTSKKRGDWHTWPNGKEEQFTLRDGQKVDHNQLHAGRVEYDAVKETPVFPCKGWILERWMPQWVFGTRDQWSPNLGPYPEEGDYWMMSAEPHEQLPDISDLEQAISTWEYEWLKRPRDFESAYRLFVEEERIEAEARRLKAADELMDFLRSEGVSDELKDALKQSRDLIEAGA